MEKVYKGINMSGTKNKRTLLLKECYMYCENNDYSVTYTDNEIKRLIKRFLPQMFSENKDSNY